MSDSDSITIQRAETQDAATLTDICVRAFHSDVDFGTEITEDHQAMIRLIGTLD